MPRILDLDPETYVRHPIHTGDRTWAETNCYSDVVIELLHGMGFEPRAALAFTLAIDFDVDQWTFFKFPHADIEALFALSICELAPWRPLVEHIEDQIAAGRPVLIELDSFFLPDTAGTAYKLAHVKSTVAVNEIDTAQETLGYFHNQAYYALQGEDFQQVFQTTGLVHDRMLPPYIEFVKPLPRAQPLTGQALLEASLGQLDRQLQRIPALNPFLAFRARLEADMDGLMSSDIEHFHAYSFATLRQLGAGFELAATYLRWLSAEQVTGLEPATTAFDQISSTTKALQFRLARAMARRRALPMEPLEEMATLWEQGMDALQNRPR
ncbi:MAG: hypothetical protein ACI8S6_004483 [Myxococcota bacterium]|jgi:hypothetical protein